MTEEEKRKLIIEILYIPTDTDQQVYYIGQFTLYYGTTLNNLTKKERQEHDRKSQEELKKIVERIGDGITTDHVISKCKKDRKFYEELLMKLDEGILFTD